MRITLITDTELVNANYRAYQPMQVLMRDGHVVAWNRRGEPRFDPVAIMRSDAVLIHRYVGPEIRGLAQRLATAGIGVVWDNDDDIGALPKTNPLYARFGGTRLRAIAPAIRNMVQIAHVVTTPSSVLADKYRESGGADVRLLENYLPPAFCRVSPIRHDGVVIVWVAGLEHQIDYQKLQLRDAFERVLDAHPNVRIMSVGLNLGLRGERYEHVRGVDFRDLAGTLVRCDIGVAPLVDIPWNRARSNVKLKEYGAARLPWLASPVAPYASLGERQGGRLVANDDWYAALHRLITNERERHRLAKRAAKWAKGETVDRHAKLWLVACADAAARAQSQSVSRSSAITYPA